MLGFPRSQRKLLCSRLFEPEESAMSSICNFVYIPRYVHYSSILMARCYCAVIGQLEFKFTREDPLFCCSRPLGHMTSVINAIDIDDLLESLASRNCPDWAKRWINETNTAEPWGYARYIDPEACQKYDLDEYHSRADAALLRLEMGLGF